MIERCRALYWDFVYPKKERIKFWWCNPGPWTTRVIFISLIAWAIGMLLISITLASIIVEVHVWDKEMAADRKQIKRQMDFIQNFLPNMGRRGFDIPEGGS